MEDNAANLEAVLEPEEGDEETAEETNETAHEEGGKILIMQGVQLKLSKSI